MVKELVPIVLSCAAWERIELVGNRVLVECDNSSMVIAMNKHYARDQTTMHLLWSLWFFVAHFDIDLKCKRLDNSTADHLSRDNLHLFFHLHPQVTREPTPLPLPLLEILAAGGPDWTSPRFMRLFSIITNMA